MNSNTSITKGDHSSEPIKMNASKIPTIYITALSPAMNRGIINETYIKAVPASGCKKIKKAGKKIVLRANTVDCLLFTWKLVCAKRTDNVMAVVNLVNSEGCTEKPNKWNHELAPFTSCPKSNTAIKTRIETP